MMKKLTCKYFDGIYVSGDEPCTIRFLEARFLAKPYLVGSYGEGMMVQELFIHTINLEEGESCQQSK
jgi:hypothetical protein